MAQNVSERLAWAVRTLAVGPRDRVLEIGCGHGVAVTLICEALAGGHVTAIDRSRTMIDMAARRNAAHVAAGRASFMTASLQDADLGTTRFDRILAVHVRLFLMPRPARDLDIVRRHLAPHGRLHVVFQPLHASHVDPTARSLSATLEAHGFTIHDLLIEPLHPVAGVCIVAGCR